MVKIQKQTEAEKDSFLIECFHDSGIIDEILRNNFSIIVGRKGTGKTAVALYVQQKFADYNIDFATRISIRGLAINKGSVEREESILFFILIKTLHELIKNKLIAEKALPYWSRFCEQHNAINFTNFESFIEYAKTKKGSKNFSSLFPLPFIPSSTKLEEEQEVQYRKTDITSTPRLLFDTLKDSIKENKRILIFIDDTTDHLDESTEITIIEDIQLIQKILLKLDSFSEQIKKDQSIKFVSLIRDDVLDSMNGSNVNKLKNSTYSINWKEKDFASLIIKRLPIFEGRTEEALKDPIKSIKEQFPDNIFADALSNFNSKQYATKFYAYMMAISFNRPRDFLKFCYCMQERLSTRHLAERENIDSAETEYSDYFINEIRDELYIASKLLSLDFTYEKLEKLIDLLNDEAGINFTDLKTRLSQYLGIKTSHNKIRDFTQALWTYGILGFKEKDKEKKDFAYFKYMTSVNFYVEKLKEYLFFLHRGLWWFSKKRTKN